MNKITLLVLSCLLTTALFAQGPGYANLPNLDPYNPEFAPGVVLVKFKDDVPVRIQKTKSVLQTGIVSVDEFIIRHKVKSVEKVFTREEKQPVKKYMTTPDGVNKEISQMFNIYKFTTDFREDVKKMVEEFKSDPLIDFAEPDYYFYSQATEPNDPMASQQWYLGVFPGVNAKNAWDVTTGDTTQILGIIDTGVDWTHPDLCPNIWTNRDEIPGNGIDDDGNGYIDDVRGWDFVNLDNNPMDDNSHGTHVAGIAAARGNNNIGIAGIAWNARIMPLKVMQSSGYGSSSDIANGVNYARLNGATVLNLSLGSYGESLTLKTALENAYSTAVIVAAAGNNGYKIDPPYPPAPIYAPLYPACYPWIIGIMSSSPDGSLAGFSNFDPSGPIDAPNQFGHNYEIKAPGVNILSTFPNGGYHVLNGTSMAAPIVSGAVALIKSHNPTLSTEELFARLIQGANNGILDVYNALNYTLVPDLNYASNTIVDTLPGDDRDAVPDAGETIQLYLKVKNAGGFADSVWSKIRFAPYEDTTVATIIDSTSYIGDISTYASMTGQTDPFKICIKQSTANNRDIVFQYEIGAKNTVQRNIGAFRLTVTNGEELGGLYYGSKHLNPDKLYLVTSNAVFDTLIIDPGTRIQISDGKSIFISSKMICDGRPDSMIVFTQNGTGYWLQIKNVSNGPQSMQYCIFEYFGSSGGTFPYHLDGFTIENSIFRYGALYMDFLLNADSLRSCLLTKNFINFSSAGFGSVNIFQNNTIIGNSSNQQNNPTFLKYFGTTGFSNNSIFGNTVYNYCGQQAWGITKLSPNYWGTIDSLTIEHSILDFFENSSFGIVDGSNSSQTAPSPLCHGHIWKILIDSIDVNKFDNPYNSQNGLGIVGPGQHRFDVYFNRAMDVSVTPFLTFGVREPFTQKVVTDSASWSADSTIWTAYYNIGIETGDGIQRVRVQGAQDNEHFEIPIEDSRFEFVIQAAGAASIEFMATPGIGKVFLEWNRAGTEDALGYNMYRFNNINDSTYTTPVRINTSLITDTLFTDFNVIPDTTYHYYYKIVGTDLAESDSSKMVVAVPFAAANGDANGDLAVNVLDITSVIAYMLGQDPQPFLFDAADVNGDHVANILDVIGLVNLINGNKKAGSIDLGVNSNPAYIYLDTNSISFSSKGQVAALQFELTGQNVDRIRLLLKQQGFELATGVSKGKLSGIIYNLENRAIPEGMLKLVGIDGKNSPLAWGEVTAGDPEGRQVTVLKNFREPIADNIQLQAFPNPFTENISIQYSLAESSKTAVRIVSMNGQLIRILSSKDQPAGIHQLEWNGRNQYGNLMPSGAYLCKMEVTTQAGKKIQQEVKIILIK
ncbi:MAG: S8 family serine peptidase [Bacteroidales bacterium]|nr:S8 family serine peptidase [Bacteroidales bacterium]